MMRPQIEMGSINGPPSECLEALQPYTLQKNISIPARLAYTAGQWVARSGDLPHPLASLADNASLPISRGFTSIKPKWHERGRRGGKLHHHYFFQTPSHSSTLGTNIKSIPHSLTSMNLDFLNINSFKNIKGNSSSRTQIKLA
jgi:hypothetical protein